MKKVLIVSAHPGDVESGMGGLLTLLVRAGHEVLSLITTLPDDPTQSDRRMEESTRSHRLVDGIDVSFFMNKSDGGPKAADSKREMLTRTFQSFDPDVVFTHWPVDVHPDHRAAADMVFDHCLQLGVNTELLCFETCTIGRSSDAVRPQTLGFYPTHYVNLPPLLVEDKQKLVACHESLDTVGIWNGCKITQLNRGLETQYGNAEAFVRLTRCGDLDPELRKLITSTKLQLTRGIGPSFIPASIDIII